MKKSVFWPCLLTAAVTAAMLSGIAFLMAKDMTVLKPYPVKSAITAEELQYDNTLPTVGHGGVMQAYTDFYFGVDDGIVLTGAQSDVFLDLENIESYVYDPANNELTFQKDGWTFACAMAVFEPQDNTNTVIIWQTDEVSKYCLPVCINEAGDTFLIATEVKGAATKEEYAQIEKILVDTAQRLSVCSGDADVINIAGLSIPTSVISTVSPDYVVLNTDTPSYLSVEPASAEEQVKLYQTYDSFVNGPFALRYSKSVQDTATGYRPYVFCIGELRFTLYAPSTGAAEHLAAAFSAA